MRMRPADSGEPRIDSFEMWFRSSLSDEASGTGFEHFTPQCLAGSMFEAVPFEGSFVFLDMIMGVGQLTVFKAI